MRYVLFVFVLFFHSAWAGSAYVGTGLGYTSASPKLEGKVDDRLEAEHGWIDADNKRAIGMDSDKGATNARIFAGVENDRGGAEVGVAHLGRWKTTVEGGLGVGETTINSIYGFGFYRAHRSIDLYAGLHASNVRVATNERVGDGPGRKGRYSDTTVGPLIGARVRLGNAWIGFEQWRGAGRAETVGRRSPIVGYASFKIGL